MFNWNNRQQIRKQEQLLAHARISIHNIFYNTMEFLEKYIEITGYYDDWQKRKQIADNSITRKDINGNPEKAKKAFSVVLFGLRQALEENPVLSLREELKAEFSRWISSVGISSKNCHDTLKHVLFEVNEILEGHGEKILEEVLNRKETTDVNAPDFEERLNSVFLNVQSPLIEGRKREKLLGNKKGNEIQIDDRFDGEKEEGENFLKEISKTISSSRNNFVFFAQKNQWTNFQIIQDVKNNPQRWRIDEVITEWYPNDEEKVREMALVHDSAQIGYDGEILDNNQVIYLTQIFNQAEINEINRALNISEVNQIEQKDQKNEELMGLDENLVNNQTAQLEDGEADLANLANFNDGGEILAEGPPLIIICLLAFLLLWLLLLVRFSNFPKKRSTPNDPNN